MKIKTVLKLIGIIALIVVSYFCIYIYGLASMWNLNTTDDSPFYITKKELTVKNITLPKGTKITYEENFFWQKHEQEKPLSEKNITGITLNKGVTINWAGVPISSILKFYNSEMKGYTINANFNKLKDEHKTNFSNTWLSCNNDLSITVENTDDWSFNKKNILDIESCGVNYQRYFKKDTNQQRLLDKLYQELNKIKD